jgi:HEAT repeat protein
VLPSLADALRDRDSGVRLIAVRSLSKIAGLQADELIRSSLRDRDEAVRMAAMKALKKRGLGGS